MVPCSKLICHTICQLRSLSLLCSLLGDNSGVCASNTQCVPWCSQIEQNQWVGKDGQRSVTQYHDVMGAILGKWAKAVVIVSHNTYPALLTHLPHMRTAICIAMQRHKLHAGAVAHYGPASHASPCLVSKRVRA